MLVNFDKQILLFHDCPTLREEIPIEHSLGDRIQKQLKVANCQMPRQGIYLFFLLS